eukprot:358593-Chlamydomonas_euryale.AAC.7
MGWATLSGKAWHRGVLLRYETAWSGTLSLPAYSHGALEWIIGKQKQVDSDKPVSAQYEHRALSAQMPWSRHAFSMVPACGSWQPAGQGVCTVPGCWWQRVKGRICMSCCTHRSHAC